MNLHGSKSYRRIYFSVISLLLTVMLLFSVFFYRRFINLQKEEIDLKAQESIERIESWMNTQYQEMMRIVLEINDDGIFSYVPITSKSQREDLLQELIRYVRGNSFWTDMSYESMLDEETVYSSQGIFKKDSFDKYVYGVNGSFDREAFLTRRSHQPFTTVSSEDVIVRQYPQATMAYIYGLPMMSDNPKRLITFYVTKGAIDHIVRQFLPCDVLDVRFYERDTLVYTLNAEHALPEDAAIVSCAGGTGQYRYELIVDPNVLYADYRATQLFYFLTLGVMIVVILLASWMVALYNYQPLHQLVSKYAGGQKGNLDEYALLNELVEDTIEQKREIQKKLFISNVVWDQYETLDSLHLDAQEAGVVFQYPEFTCCACEYTDAEKGENLSERICEELDTPHAMAICAKRDGGKRLTIVINHTGTPEASRLAETVFQNMEHVCVGVGTQARDILHLSESYHNARQALHEARDRGVNFLRYADLPEPESENAEKEERTRAKTPPNTELLQSILTCMQSNLSDTGMSLEFIAGKCGVSASYLVRYFKSCMDVTPMQYVDSLRMDIARRLLTTTTQSLREIVEQCGYLNESNFARKFKKLEGITPMNYRKINWKDA